MKSRVLVLISLALLIACARKAAPTITADPSGKPAPSVAPARNEAAAIYALVLRDHFAALDASGFRVIDTLALPSCGRTEKISSSLPTTRTDTLAAFGRLPSDQLLAPFAPTLGLDLIPLGDAIRLIASAPAPGTALPAGWPAIGLVRFTPIAFDATQSDALVSYEHWSTPESPQALVIHLVKRDGSWLEQEILRCP